MKYKKQIATGALAISLLVGGSSVFAATPQDLGIKNTTQVYQKQNKNSKTKNIGKSKVVGIISSINNTSFMIDVTNAKAKTTSSTDIIINPGTRYSKNGIAATFSDIAIGQKVIVVGSLDKATNIITAKIVKIVS